MLHHARRLFATCLLAATVVLPAAAARADDGESLTLLRDSQVAVYAIVRDFHMLTLLPGERERTRGLQQRVAGTGAALGKVPAASGPRDEAVTAARNEYKHFAELALANNIVKDGYTDDNLVGELYDSAELVSSSLGKAIAGTEGGGAQRKLADQAHAANLLMQRAAAAYIKRSAQMSPDIGAEIPYDLGEATKELDKRMTALAAALRNNKAAGNSMRNVMTKWNFIKPSLLNYNDKAVPYIVDRYAGQVMLGLRQVVADLSQ